MREYRLPWVTRRRGEREIREGGYLGQLASGRGSYHGWLASGKVLGFEVKRKSLVEITKLPSTEGMYESPVTN